MNKITKTIKNNQDKAEIYRIIDSFLVEAKDQDGRERSLEQLNQDRHLAANRFRELIDLQKAEIKRNLLIKIVPDKTNRLYIRTDKYPEGELFRHKQIIKLIENL